jgi:hypothetical protein
MVCATAAVAHACPDGYSGKFSVIASGSQSESAAVKSFPSVSPCWIAVTGRQKELDPVLLLWKMHQRIRRDLLPPARTVVEFDFTGRNRRRLWLVLKPREVSVCLKPPGFDPNLVVHADFGIHLSRLARLHRLRRRHSIQRNSCGWISSVGPGPGCAELTDAVAGGL